MPDELSLRITVVRPPAGVAWAVQNGQRELIQPSHQTTAEVSFDVVVRVGSTGTNGAPNFLGSVAQGPPTRRFIYLNSGSRAGQAESCWDRRAKVLLTGIDRSLLATVRATPGGKLEARIAGTAGDGGPACATVPLLDGGWRVMGPQPPDQRL